MPDGNFNGVELIWIAAIMMLAVVAFVASRRATTDSDEPAGGPLTNRERVEAAYRELGEVADSAWSR